MADKKELPAFPAEAVEYLEQLDHCINDVQSRLDGQKNSKYVTRFVEKNLLTHKCMNLYALLALALTVCPFGELYYVMYVVFCR